MSIKVIVVGLGAMGGGMVKMLMDKEGIEIVAAAAGRSSRHGKDLGEVLELGKETGVKVSSLDDALKNDADIVLHSTTSFTKEACPDIIKMLESKKNVISIAEEMSYPAVQTPDLADKMDEAAKKNNVTLLGTGVNPGFVLDTLILTLSGACADVKTIKASRVNDLSPFGATVMRTQGVGTTVKEFNKGIEEGNIVGHIGFKESAMMIADALGWEFDEIKETREPIVSNTYRETPHVKVKEGMVAGCKHICYGIKDGKTILTLEHPQQIHPHMEGTETGDYINIEGTPDVNMAIQPEIPGGIGTIATAVNMIPLVVKAEPGLVSMADLPIPRAILGDAKKLMDK